MNIERAFEEYYDRVDVYPSVPASIALTDGVDQSAVEQAGRLGMDTVDLIKTPVPDALRALSRHRVAAVLGRGGLDNELRRRTPDTLWDLREYGMLSIARLGNGVDMDVQRAYDRGLITFRTPRASAPAVTMWQDLLLMAMYYGSDHAVNRDNPALEDNVAVKNGEVDKFKWDNKQAEPVLSNARREFEAGNIFAGKRVAIIGGGQIARIMIRDSIFLVGAEISVYDKRSVQIDDVTVVDNLDDALKDAELVIMAASGREKILGERELSLLKRGAMLCSVATRGETVEPEALYRAIESRQISRAGLDVHVVEGKELRDFEDIPADESARQPGHWAVLLRRHPNVIATNHSAANEKGVQRALGIEGVTLVHNFNALGEISDGVGAPDVSFPYDGFVQGNNGYQIVPINYRGPRVALEVIHDGGMSDLVTEARIALRPVISGRANIVTGKLTSVKMGDRRNAVQFDAIDLPEAVWDQVGDRRLMGEITRALEAVRGVHRARVFLPKRKVA